MLNGRRRVLCRSVSPYQRQRPLFREAWRIGKIINGVELKCVYNGRILDVLGYDFDLDKMNNWINTFYKDKSKAMLQTKYFENLYNTCMSLGLKIEEKEKIVWNPNVDWASVTIFHELIKNKEENLKIF